MPPDHQQQEQRRASIATLLEEHQIRTQSDLVARLRTLGHHVTQSSISRDLTEMRVTKGSNGYELASGEIRGGGTEGFAFVRRLTAAGTNLLVINTAIGAAQRVALELDRSGWPEIIGTISGDDTIFVATAGATATRRLISRIQQQPTSPSHAD